MVCVIWLWIFVLFGFALRLAPLGRYVTPDEPAWVYRSVRFADALMARDWSAIPRTGHPGVTTMWLGAGGVFARRLARPHDSVRHLEWVRKLAWLAPENGEAARHLAPFLPWGRVAVALVTTLGLVALYPLLSRLFDRRVALLTVGLLAFDPFLIGHSGLLHTDALLATCCLLALTTALLGLREPRRAAWWMLSGLFAALALLTKTPGLVLLPFILSLIVVRRLQLALRHSRSVIRHSSFVIRHSSLFIVSLFITLFALYPATWSEPLAALRATFSFASRQIEMAQRPVFFAGRMRPDPGPAFYPVAFLFRVSPVVLVGLIVGLIFLRRLPPDRRLAFLALLAFAVLFGAGMSLGAKKHDRYLLPALSPLTLAGALGIGILVDWYTGKLGNWYTGKLVRHTSLSRLFYQSTNLPIYQSTNLPTLLQAIIALLFAAYPLLYYNPLLGGPAVAARVLPTGWGECVGTAARQLNQRPDAAQLTVAAVNVPSFAPLFEGHTVPLEESTIPLSDYIVATSPDQIRSLANLHTCKLAHLQTCTLANLQTRIYTNTAPFEQAAYLAGRVRPGDLIMVDADTSLSRRYEGPGTLFAAADLEGAPSEAALHEWLAERVSGRDALWLVASPGASPITAAHLRRQVDVFAEPVSAVTVASAAITQYATREPRAANPPSQIATFGGRLTLVDGALPQGVAWPNALRAVLRWQAQPAPLTDYQAIVTLRGRGSHSTSFQPAPPTSLPAQRAYQSTNLPAYPPWSTEESLVRSAVNFPTSAWEAGQWCDVSYELELPAGIPPGDYAIEVSLYDTGTGAKLGASGPDGAFLGTQVPVGRVRVTPPAAPPDVAALKIAEQLGVSLGPLTLLGIEPPPEQVLSGDHLSFALFWQADATPDVDYRVRLRLVGPEGPTGMEDIHPLSPYPTSQWRAGDRFQGRYTLHIAPTLPAGRYQLVLDVLSDRANQRTSEEANQRGSESARKRTSEEASRPIASPLYLATIEVLPRDRSFALPEDIPHRLELTFGELIHLRGYALPGAEVAPGAVIPLTLYWQAGGPTDRSYTLFVHLLGPDGLPHGQVDRIPGNGTAPTSSWAAGQVIVEEIALPVAADAPPGTYRIAVGFYDASYGDRLVAVDSSGQTLAGDQAILTAVEVTER